MAKRTVKTLAAEIDSIRYEMGNVQVSVFTLWHWEQIAVEIEKYDRYGEIIKAELTKSMEPGKRQYQLTIYHRPLLNQEKRKMHSGDTYYSALERSASRYFPK